MELLLEIISHHRYSLPDEKSYYIFKATGGTIGRNVNNDWSIDDPERIMSGHHSSIYFENNHFVIVDTSTNGLFVNNREQPLASETHIIINGDKFSMGQYQFQATIVVNQDSAIYSSCVSTGSHRSSNSSAQENVNVGCDIGHSQGFLLTGNSAHKLDPLQHFEDVVNSKPRNNHNNTDFVLGRDPMKSILQPIPSTQSFFNLPFAIPEDWQENEKTENDTISDSLQLLNSCEQIADDLSGYEQFEQVGSFEDFQQDFNIIDSHDKNLDSDEFRVTDTPEPSNDTVHSILETSTQSNDNDKFIAADSEFSKISDLDFTDQNDDITILLTTLGIKKNDIEPEQLSEIVRNIALIARNSMSGLMQTMVSRAHLKNEFRMSMTTVKTEENNPLKFCINYDQLVHYMLLKPMSGYLDVDNAIKQSFDELQEHQVGVMAGMKAALIHMLNKLSPDKISDMVNRNKANSLVLGSKKRRCWDIYSELYNDLLDEDDVFNKLFSNEFCRAYEKQIEHIRASRQVK